MTATKFGFGHAVTRKEDDKLLRGAGRYVADFAPAGVLHAIVLRSPHAHARFAITDTQAAQGKPGVRLVLTAADVADLGDLPCTGVPPGVRVEAPPYQVLARDEVRHVGDAIAFVVADTLEQAKDAAEAITMEWAALPHVVDAVAALHQGAPPVWPDRPGNVAFAQTLGDEKATADAFASATWAPICPASPPIFPMSAP
jgi:aerobic carbon-monoxide dehydrogenase large subunit